MKTKNTNMMTMKRKIKSEIFSEVLGLIVVLVLYCTIASLKMLRGYSVNQQLLSMQRQIDSRFAQQ